MHFPSTRAPRAAGLALAALALGLAAPAGASVTFSGFQATSGGTNTPIDDGYQVGTHTSTRSVPENDPTTSSGGGGTETIVTNTGPDGTYTDEGPYAGKVPNYSYTEVDYNATRIASSAAAAGSTSNYGVVVFSEAPNSFAGQSFQSLFLSGTAYTEAEVANYIGNGLTGANTTDSGAFDTFFNTLNTTYSGAPGGTPTAYEFSGGQGIGTVSGGGFSTDSGTYGFGLTPESVSAAPEPSEFAALGFLGLGLGGLLLRARRRSHAG